jgi:hypothetical protein
MFLAYSHLHIGGEAPNKVVQRKQLKVIQRKKLVQRRRIEKKRIEKENVISENVVGGIGIRGTGMMGTGMMGTGIRGTGISGTASGTARSIITMMAIITRAKVGIKYVISYENLLFSKLAYRYIHSCES